MSSYTRVLDSCHALRKRKGPEFRKQNAFPTRKQNGVVPSGGQASGCRAAAGAAVGHLGRVEKAAD